MAAVSVDLASRRYRDIGIAVLEGTPAPVRVRLVQAHEEGLNGTPDVQQVARLCTDLAAEVQANLILIDGPQGWRASSSPFEHMRGCERCTRTPGKTGIPGRVLPATWTRMARFSIDLFDALDADGWPRFSGRWPAPRAAVETFPTYAWRTLGLDSLPAKRRWSPDLKAPARLLSSVIGVRWPRQPTHDELQAVVADVAGLMLQWTGLSACEVHGRPPIREVGSWREGYLVSPTKPPNRRGEATASATPGVLPAAWACFCGWSASEA